MKVNKEDQQKLEASSALAWTLFNDFKTETGDKLEVHDRKYLVDVFEDNSKSIAIKKSSQVAFSTTFIIKCFHLAYFNKMNIAFTLPTNKIVQDFVKPKVNPLVLQNPTIGKIITEDSQTLKKVGSNFIYFRGSWGEREAITISLDLICGDEYDRSATSVLEIYQSRLKASKYRWFWRFSNPSIPLGGVDFYWSTSDKKEWFMLCKHCGHRSFATWEQRERYKTHFVDVDKSVLICGKCGKSLSDEDRRDGEWVAEYPNKKISGYHLSHLICPWISIEEIIEESHGSPTYFHNFILGEPYVTKDLAITRETIVNCVAPNRPKDVVQWFMGVDQKAGPKHWCIGCITKNGQKWIRGYGMTRSWDDIERLRNERDAIMVCDAQPYQTIPKKLSKKYPGRVFLNWYKEDTKNVGVVRWGRSSPAAPLETHKVFADRTGIFDELVYSLNNREVLYSMSLPQLEDYIGHLTVMYRAQIEQPERAPGAESEKKAAWVCPTGQADDWAHATVYVLIGMTRAILQSGRSVKFRSPETEKDSDKVWHVQPDQTITRPEMNILEMLKKKRKKRGKHWMYK